MHHDGLDRGGRCGSRPAGPGRVVNFFNGKPDILSCPKYDSLSERGGSHPTFATTPASNLPAEPFWRPVFAELVFDMGAYIMLQVQTGLSEFRSSQ